MFFVFLCILASSGEEGENGDESETSSSEDEKSGERSPSSVMNTLTVSEESRKELDGSKSSGFFPKNSDARPDLHLLPTQSQSSLVSYGGGDDDDEDDQFAKGST